MKSELTNKNLHYNMLACPHCSNLLYDQLHEYEKNKEVKTIACTSCDFLGKRISYQILTLVEIKKLTEQKNEYKRTYQTV